MTLICVEAADQQQGLSPRKTSDGFTHDSPFPIRLLAREIQRNGEHINVGERTRQPATPIFEVSPICGRRRGNQSALHAGESLKEQKKLANEQWRLKPTPTCGAMLESRNVSSMASYGPHNKSETRMIGKRERKWPQGALDIYLRPFRIRSRHPTRPKKKKTEFLGWSVGRSVGWTRTYMCPRS